jgi:hypothetical protein
MKLKRFEAFLGDRFIAWVAEGPVVSITLTNRLVKIIQKVEGALVNTVLDLDLLPAYTFVKAD